MSVQQYKNLIEQSTEAKAKELGVKPDKAFETLANSLIMQAYDLSDDELEAGITDGGGDGQIDAMFVIVNGRVLTDEDVEGKSVPDKGPLEIDIAMIQTKNTDSFEENPLRSVRATVSDLLDLGRDYDTLTFDNYNDNIQKQMAIARYALRATTGRQSSIRATLYYACKGDNANIHGSVAATGAALENDLRSATTTKDASVVYVSPKDLIELSRLPKTKVRQLAFQENLSHDGNSVACLVSIGSLMEFLSDEKGNIIRPMFDANVRDFLGSTTDVNEAIYETLQSLEDEDFWWFNNGITLVADAIDQKGKVYALTDPLLVNGLQTSNVIHGFMSSEKVKQANKDHIREKRVLVRIIKPTSDAIRDTIIRATNSQTHIPKPYLRAMDRIHRNIEDHLKQVGLYYERRKNHYRNQGIARPSIVTLTEMAQALVSALLMKGGDARGRPNSLLKSDEDYELLFSEKYPLDTFTNIILAKRNIMIALAEMYPGEPAAFRNNVVWHTLAFISGSRFFNTLHAAKKWSGLELDYETIQAEAAKVVGWFGEAGATDGVSKSPGFQETIIQYADAARKQSVANKSTPSIFD